MNNESINKYIEGEDFVGSITKIARTYSLHIDQENALYLSTQALLLGNLASKDYVLELVDKLEVNYLVAESIAKDVNENIIKNIKHLLVERAYIGDNFGVEIPEQKKEPVSMYSGGLPASEPTDSYANLSKDEVLRGIEDPVSSQTHSRVTISNHSFPSSAHIIPKDKLVPNTPPELVKEIVQEALVEASAHTFTVPQPKNTAQQALSTDLKHRIPSHESKVFFLPTEHITIDASDIIEDEAGVENSDSAKKDEAGISSNEEVAPQPIKKRPLADIIPSNIPRKYNIDPYRESVE